MRVLFLILGLLAQSVSGVAFGEQTVSRTAAEAFDRTEYVQSLQKQILDSFEFENLPKEQKIKRLEAAIESVTKAVDSLNRVSKVPTKECCGSEYQMPKAFAAELLAFTGLIAAVVNTGKMYSAFGAQQELKPFVENHQRQIVALAKEAEERLTADPIRSEALIQNLRWLQRARPAADAQVQSIFNYDEYFLKSMKQIEDTITEIDNELKEENLRLKAFEDKGLTLGIKEARARYDAKRESMLRLKLSHFDIAELYVKLQPFHKKVDAYVVQTPEEKLSAKRASVASVLIPAALSVGAFVYARREINQSFISVPEAEKAEMQERLEGLLEALREVHRGL